MLIRLVPFSPHPTILYDLTFPSVLPLHDLGLGATIPAAWSSQLQILISVLQLEPPSSIHLLDRAVGLVARVREVSMDISRKEMEVSFVDGQVVIIPMNSDCVRMLSSVVVDIKGCSEPEIQRSSMETSLCPGNTAGSVEDHPSGGSPTKSPKLGRHKRQRSLLFSLISSLVPRSLSLSSPPRPSSAPPQAPLPPLPILGSMTPPIPSRQASPSPARPDPEIFRRRARATLIDVWRRYVISALTPQHLPAAGYAEWILVGMASKIRAEIGSIKAIKSYGFGVSSTKACGNRHRRTQSDGRNALDFGDRMDDCEPEQWRCRAPSPFSDILNTEDTDQVVYPRREQADEWGVRYVHRPRSSDEANIFSVECDGHSNNFLEEHFIFGDDWIDDERFTFELSRTGRHATPGMYSPSPRFEDRDLHPVDFGLDYNDVDENRLADVAFDVSSCPLTPSDVNDDEESDDSQTSVRTPEDGEVLPLVPPAQKPQGSTQHTTSSVPQPPLVSRVSSSRPRSRNASAQYLNASSTPELASPPPTSSTVASSSAPDFDSRDTQADEFIGVRLASLERICAALEIIRNRAREEGWILVRATSAGAKNGWSDAATEKSLEIKAKRRAWSSGVKISATYPTRHSAPKVWDGSLSTFRSLVKPPGLDSIATPRACGPIVPTGLSLGIPVRNSPLAMYTWVAEDGRRSTPSRHGILGSAHRTETMQGKRSSRLSFVDSVTKLFPVREDDSEDLFEPVRTNAVGFPQTVPLAVSADEPERDLVEGPAENEDDPFYFCPSWPRKRTTSMYMIPPTPLAPSPPPMIRCSTPPPHNQAVVGGDISIAANDEEGRLDASALLLQPVSSSVSTLSQLLSPRPPLTSNPSFVPRPRAVSLPTPRSYSSTNKSRRTSFNHKDEHYEDLSRAYASPPPEGPLVISRTPVPREQYPKYAHVHSPIPASKKGMNASILGRTGKEVVFAEAGSEFTVGIEVALGRAEEGRVVW